MFGGRINGAQHAVQDPLRRIRLLPFVLIVLVVAKAWSIAAFYTASPSAGIDDLFSRDVAAQTIEGTGEPAAVTSAPPEATEQTRQWALKEDFTWSYELVLALQKRDEELRIREHALVQEEERLAHVIGQLDERIGVLSGLERRIADLIEQKRIVENEKMVKLAKVFEETPPEQAGPLISRLDVDIAAQLILRMNNRKAGRMWGFVEAGQAVKISEELARLSPGFKMVPGDQ